MKKYILLYLIIGLIFPTSCKDIEADSQEGENPVTISGLVTRADGRSRNIYVKAFHPGNTSVYFNETLASVPDGLSETTDHNIIFTGTNPYYPLGGTTEINIFAFTGTTSSNRMILEPGTGFANDYVLSNYGKRTSDAAINPAYAPSGTPGSSEDPAEILQFRHVMTQLIVEVELGDPEIDPEPETLQFTLDGGIVGRGYYSIFSNDNGIATDTTGVYAVKLGTNYLVPSGEDLLGKKLKSLVIDKYTATSSDLQGFTIQALENQTSMPLLPGYAYRLVFTINRLQVTGITLTKINWVPELVDSEISYEATTLGLSLGDYINTDTDLITKVILRTTDDKTYVGGVAEGKTDIEFVTLPPSGSVQQVTLYTSKGLLITADIPTAQYDGSTLILPISVGGMVLEDPGTSPGPNNPYLIENIVQFINVSKDLSAHYKQAETIDLNTLNLIEPERIFNGFGNFSGTFDGDGYRIDGIDIQAPGLFRSASNTAVIRNIRLTTGTIDATGSDFAGGICGNNSGTIVACVNEADILNAGNPGATLGGICGINSATGTVIGCVNTGTVLDATIAGGICGFNTRTDANTFIACINTGELNPDENAIIGFVCGTSTNSPNAVINTCFGLVGSAQHSLGGAEYAVGSGVVNDIDTSTMEPLILRNNLQEGETDENKRVVNRLNIALSATAWGATYRYVYDNAVTFITWPAPVKI